MASHLTRRDFLSLCTLALGTLAFRPMLTSGQVRSVRKVRVTTYRIHLYREPSFSSERLVYRKKDQILGVYEEIHSPAGPKHNPRWYRIPGGYAHSAYLQNVTTRLNTPLDQFPKKGRVCEVTVPYTLSMRRNRKRDWQPLYRLYYGSHHWVQNVDEGPDGKPWYRILDERLRVNYYVPAIHLRPLDPSEFNPLSIHIPPQEKRIQVDLADQTVTAFEGDQPVFNARVSTGVYSRGPSPNGIPTDTPTGRFTIATKMPVRHMGDGRLTSDLDAYELPGVPWCCFFVSSGVAFHGTYWHDNFGTPMSRGCVNMRNQDAKWLYRWSNPLGLSNHWHRAGRGTVVDVV